MEKSTSRIYKIINKLCLNRQNYCNIIFTVMDKLNKWGFHAKTTLNQRFLGIRDESQKCMGAGGLPGDAAGVRGRQPLLPAAKPPGVRAARSAARNARPHALPGLPLLRQSGEGYAVAHAGGRRCRPSASPRFTRRGGWRAKRATCAPRARLCRALGAGET